MHERQLEILGAHQDANVGNPEIEEMIIKAAASAAVAVIWGRTSKLSGP
jgi:hypothetical protein